MKKNRLLALVLALVLVFSSMGNIFAEQLIPKEYSDLKGHWAKEKVERLVSLGIVNSSLEGAAEFQPEKKITRAEAVELILKANLPNDLLQAELKEAAKSSSFDDTRNHKLKSCVELSKKLGIIVGYEDGTFKPDGLITREEFATVLVKAQDIFEQMASENGTNTAFPDVREGRWSYNNIIIAAKAGLIYGYPDGTFGPQNDITRAEAYTITDNYYGVCFVSYKGIAGFASGDGKLLEGIDVKLISLKDGKTVQTVTSNKYGQFRFDTVEKNDFRIEAASGDMLGIIPKVIAPLKNPLLEARLTLEKTVQASGTAYNTNKSGLNKGDLSFKSGDLEFKTVTDAAGKFEINLLPNRTYIVYITVDGSTIQIGEVKVGTSALSNLALKPTTKTSGSGGSGRGGNSDNTNEPSGDDTYSLFSVTDIKRAGNTLSIESTATDACYLDVKVLKDVTGISTDLSSGTEITGGRAQIADAVDKEFIDVSFSSSLPQYFVAVATLVSESGGKLCEPYVFIENTKAYEEYEAKTIHDFDAGRVINLDGDDDNNFMVLKENVPQIKAGENGKNLLDASRAEEGIYKFTNADASITSLGVGDTIVVISGDGSQVCLIQVTSISNSNGTVTITSVVEVDMGEFFDYIKINMTETFDDAELDMSNADPEVELLDDPNDPRYDIVIDHDDHEYFIETADEEAFDDAADDTGVIYLPSDDDTAYISEDEADDLVYLHDDLLSGTDTVAFDEYGSDMIMPTADIDIEGSYSKSFSIGINYKESPLEVGGKITGTAKASVKVVYDFVLFGRDYFETKIVVGADLEMKVEVKLTGSSRASKIITLGFLKFPTPVAGLVIGAELTAPVELEGSAAVVVRAKVEVGCKFGTGGFQPISSKSFEADLKAEGALKLTIGPKLYFGVRVMFEAITADLFAHAGVEIKATAVAGSPELAYTTGDSKHACTACVDGSVDKFVKSGFVYKASLFGWDSLTYEREHTFGEWRAHWTAFFVSLINSRDSRYKGNIKFGFGSCENKVYRTTITPQDENGNTVSSAVVKAKKAGDGTQVFSANGKYTQFMYPGDYIASASGGGVAFVDKAFTVDSSAQTVIVSTRSVSGGGTLTGDVKDADSRQAILGAVVKVYDGTTQKGVISTNANGSYELPLPVGNYRVEIEFPNYITFIAYQTIEAGRVHYMESFLLIAAGSGSGTATGTIRNAKTNLALEGVQLDVRSGWNNSQYGSIVDTFYTDSSGNYNITLPYGNYTLVASKQDYITDTINIAVTRSTFVKNSTLSPISNDDVYTVVLTWGAEPRDLDSHLVASGAHVYFSDKTSAYAWLDIDDVSSYGPETITITDLASLGEFSYCVHNYTDRYVTSDAYRLAASGATVKVYKGSTHLRTYNVPIFGDGTVWNVFSMRADGQITDLNTFEYQSRPDSVGNGSSVFSLFAIDELKDYELAELLEEYSEAEELENVEVIGENNTGDPAAEADPVEEDMAAEDSPFEEDAVTEGDMSMEGSAEGTSEQQIDALAA